MCMQEGNARMWKPIVHSRARHLMEWILNLQPTLRASRRARPFLASFWQVGREITPPEWVDRAAPDGPARDQIWRNY
jgi:hypothetical protein